MTSPLYDNIKNSINKMLEVTKLNLDESQIHDLGRATQNHLKKLCMIFLKPTYSIPEKKDDWTFREDINGNLIYWNSYGLENIDTGWKIMDINKKLHAVHYKTKIIRDNERKEEKSIWHSIRKRLCKKKKNQEKIKILYVDDDDLQRSILLDKLISMNCDVDIAIDGLDGIHMAKKKKYDIILMDLTMPNCDGFQASENIREFDKNVKIIAVTAFGEDEHIVDKCKLYGMDELRLKPLRKQQLKSLLLKYKKK